MVHLQKQSFAYVLQKYVLLKVSQASKENTCVRFSFWKTWRLKACNFIKKRLQHRFFFREVYEILKNTFFYWTTPVTASAPPVAVSVFLLKSN